MPVDPLLSSLLTPLRLGSTQLRNRIVVTGHATRNVDAERLPNSDDVAYFAARARGGAAMVTMGTAAVHASSPTPYGIYANLDDRIVPRYEALAAAVHEHGALICAQLGHMGARAEGAPGGVWAPSRVSHHDYGSYPHVMDEGEIADLVDAFAGAASRAVRGGLDGVEIAVGHGQMINLFLSPLTNTRTDGWGGDDDRRFRFCREVLQAVRARDRRCAARRPRQRRGRGGRLTGRGRLARHRPAHQRGAPRRRHQRLGRLRRLGHPHDDGRARVLPALRARGPQAGEPAGGRGRADRLTRGRRPRPSPTATRTSSG